MREIREVAQRAIEQKVFAGCVIGVIAGGERQVLPFGTLAYDDTPVREDTMYDVASVTKSIPLASLAALLAEKGVLDLDKKAAFYIPELRDEHGTTLRDLLHYRVRGPRLSTLAQKTFEEIRSHVFESGFEGPPGERAYANAPAFVLGVAIERAAGEILPALAERYFFGPLGTRDTTFFPHDGERCAPTEVVAGVEVRGIVHDESARVFAKARRAVGHAGLFSTVPDLLLFAEELLLGRYPTVVSGALQGLGWQVNDPHFMGALASDTAFGKTGFTGTSVMVDVARQCALVILSNRTYPKRPRDTEAINAFRREVADTVAK